MPLPTTVEVKLSSEEAGAISITRVLTQQLSIGELFERIVSVTGKDLERIRRILRAGTLLQSATRFRWQAIESTADEIESWLARFPDPEPSLPFNSETCLEAILLDASGRAVAISRDEGSRRNLFRRKSLWDYLMKVALEQTPRYVSYSYRDSADQYRLDLTAPLRDTVLAASALLKRKRLARRVREFNLAAIEFLVPRGGGNLGPPPPT